jgi:bifunctional DNase/RNase
VPKEVVEVGVKGMWPTNGGAALFLGCPEKTFVIYVDPFMGHQFALHLNHPTHERPLTHDLVRNLLLGFEAEIQRVVITAVKEGVFWSRLILRSQQESPQKWVELDARPSDAILLAVQAKKPIFVTKEVLNVVTNVSDLFGHLLKNREN